MSIKRKKVRKFRRVDFYEKNEDHQSALLGAFGYSSEFIGRQTGLSDGQISYRLKLAGISRREIRNGSSPFARFVFQKVEHDMDDKLMAHLRRYL